MFDSALFIDLYKRLSVPCFEYLDEIRKRVIVDEKEKIILEILQTSFKRYHVLSSGESLIFSKLSVEELKDKKIILAKDIESNFKFELSNINVSVTIPEFLIAETGTAVIRSSVNEPRLLSVLTEKSIILAKKEQVLPSMSSFLKILKEKKEVINLTSAYVFITGPSRTADIEKNLVIGVHGPAELYYIIY